MKKSRSSCPRFIPKCPPPPAPPVRYDGLLPTAGLPDPVPPAPPVAGPFVAIAVGNTNEGESLPAKPRMYQLLQEIALGLRTSIPSLEKPVPLDIKS